MGRQRLQRGFFIYVLLVLALIGYGFEAIIKDGKGAYEAL